MAVNLDKPQRWKEDVALSVDMSGVLAVAENQSAFSTAAWGIEFVERTHF